MDQCELAQGRLTHMIPSGKTMDRGVGWRNEVIDVLVLHSGEANVQEMLIGKSSKNHRIFAK